MQVQRQFIEVTHRTVVIELPESFINHRVELIALMVDDEHPPEQTCRRPHPEIAGKGCTLGDLLEPIVDDEAAPTEQHWPPHSEIPGMGMASQTPTWEGFADGFSGFSEDFTVSGGLCADAKRKVFE